jgi:probable HAF family extracellular repeat protein
MNAFTVDKLGRLSRRTDGLTRGRAVARNLLFALSLALACQCALAQAMYRIKPLGYLGGCTSSPPTAYGMNASGEVTGVACSATGYSHAFLWKNNGTPMVDLTPEVESDSEGVAINRSGLVLGNVGTEFAFESAGDGAPMRRIDNSLGGASIHATALNDFGQVTGSANVADPDDPFPHAFFWANDGSPMLDLNTLYAGWYGSYGIAINAAGQVAGWVDGDRVSRVFVWLNDGSPTQDLGFGRGTAQSINAFGQVAGTYTYHLPTGANRNHAYLWRNDGSAAQDLGTLSGGQKGNSYATALNDLGQIAGSSYSLYQSRNLHAFVWLNNGTPMMDLGTFGGTKSQSTDINASGQVAGFAYYSDDTAQRAFLWRNDGTKIVDLNLIIDILDPLKPYVILTAAESINDRGDILAEGTDTRTGQSGPYLLQGTVITLSPRSIPFGSHRLGTTSAATSVTVTNTSPKPVAITSIALTGTARTQFAQTNNCGKSLGGHAVCTIKVTFKPTTKGAKVASLVVNGGGGGLRTVSLTGTGT